MQLHVLPGVFLRRDPVAPSPVVFDIPRSGAEYPRWFRSKVGLTDIQKSISMYVEELYANVPDAGATWLYACFPNAVIDANRHEADIDPGQIDGTWPEELRPDKAKNGIGLIPTRCGGNLPLYDGPLPVAEVKRRLDALYFPYHAELGRLLRAARDRFGVAYHISCHSMPEFPPSDAADAGKRRSDFDLGDRRGTTCGSEMIEAMTDCLGGFGYEVSRNAHYIGAESVRKHGNPANNIHSVQLEMNRGLYMNEATHERGQGLPKVREHLTALARHLVEFAKTRSTL